MNGKPNILSIQFSLSLQNKIEREKKEERKEREREREEGREFALILTIRMLYRKSNGAIHQRRGGGRKIEKEKKKQE